MYFKLQLRSSTFAVCFNFVYYSYELWQLYPLAVQSSILNSATIKSSTIYLTSEVFTRFRFRSASKLGLAYDYVMWYFLEEINILRVETDLLSADCELNRRKFLSLSANLGAKFTYLISVAKPKSATIAYRHLFLSFIKQFCVKKQK